MGAVSFGIGAVAFVLFLALAIAWTLTADSSAVTETHRTIDTLLDLHIRIVAPLAHVVGLALGVLSMHRREPQRVLGVVGVVFNGAFLLLMFAVAAVGSQIA